MSNHKAGILRVSKDNYLPKKIELKTKVGVRCALINFRLEDLEELKKDPLVVSIEGISPTLSLTLPE